MARTAGCEHIVKNESGYEPFSSIVQVALSKRGSNSDDYSRHPEFNAPLYVVRMCEEIHQSVQASGVHDIDLRLSWRLRVPALVRITSTSLRCAATASDGVEIHEAG